jgi:dihydrofolate reductase
VRKVIVSAEISIDGVLDDPQDFIFDYIDDDLGKYQSDLIDEADALMMGRETYEGFVDYWPAHGDEPFGDRMNSMPKYVASRTLKAPLTWNATLLKNPTTEIAALKQQPGKAILQYGIGELSLTLLQANLVDEIRLLVYPVVIGKGARLFEKIDKTAFKLLNSKTFGTGVVALNYQPVVSKL